MTRERKRCEGEPFVSEQEEVQSAQSSGSGRERLGSQHAVHVSFRG
jgi:hypothetical protein